MDGSVFLWWLSHYGLVANNEATTPGKPRFSEVEVEALDEVLPSQNRPTLFTTQNPTHDEL